MLSKSVEWCYEHDSIITHTHTLVPRQQYLMSAVLTGNVEEVESAMQSTAASSPIDSSSEGPPTKKIRLDSTQMVAMGTSTEIAIDEDMDVVQKRTFTNEQGLSPGIGVLLENTVHNCNILHVCCQLTGPGGWG